MDIERLHQVAEKLEAAGVEVTALRSLEMEVAANACPPGRLGKLKDKLKTVLKTQWENICGELSETGEALLIILIRRHSRCPLTQPTARTMMPTRRTTSETHNATITANGLRLKSTPAFPWGHPRTLAAKPRVPSMLPSGTSSVTALPITPAWLESI